MTDTIMQCQSISQEFDEDFYSIVYRYHFQGGFPRGRQRATIVSTEANRFRVGEHYDVRAVPLEPETEAGAS